MEVLPTVPFGSTGLNVTRLGFGTALSNPSDPSKDHWTEQAAAHLLNQVLDKGINFIDTSYDYVDAERRIGASISHRYDEFTLATKCGCTDTLPGLNASEHEWTRDNLFRGLEISLNRLGRENVDVIQLHNPSIEDCEKGGLVDALTDMKKSGQVRYIGVSTMLPDLPTYLTWGVFDVMQIPYSALEREHEEWITRAGEAGVGIIIRGGVAQGEPGRGSGSPDRWATFEQAGLDELRETDESRSAWVLRYTLTHPHAHTIIVGTTRSNHLKENLEALHRGPLPEDVYAEAKQRLDRAAARPSPAI